MLSVCLGKDVISEGQYTFRHKDEIEIELSKVTSYRVHPPYRLHIMPGELGRAPSQILVGGNSWNEMIDANFEPGAFHCPTFHFCAMNARMLLLHTRALVDLYGVWKQ